MQNEELYEEILYQILVNDQTGNDKHQNVQFEYIQNAFKVLFLFPFLQKRALLHVVLKMNNVTNTFIKLMYG